MSEQHDQVHDHEYMHAHGIAHSHGHVHENQKAVVNCSEVLIQLAAVRSALGSTGKVILQDHMRHCMVDAINAGDQAAVDELCQAVEKLIK